MVECEECHDWFHPACLGINIMDECELNSMFILCVDCQKKLNKNIEFIEEIVPEDFKKTEEPEEYLGKRNIEDLTDNRFSNDVMQYPIQKLQNLNYAPQILYESNFDKALPKENKTSLLLVARFVE